VLLGLVLCLGLALAGLPSADAPSPALLLGAASAEAALGAQAPGEDVPPSELGGDEEDVEEAFPDTTELLLPSEVGLKPAENDSIRARGPAAGLTHTPLSAPAAPGGSGAGGTPPAARPARRGIFGLHPAAIVLGLVAAHVLLTRVLTD
jgi:hypothetical protein